MLDDEMVDQYVRIKEVGITEGEVGERHDSSR